MILNTKEKKALNKYFRDFVIANKDYFHDDPEKSTVKKIQKYENIPFHKSWEYLMVLVQIIENKWKFELIETESNWVRFTLNKYDAFQDKGGNKIEVFYSCCFKTLEALWKDRKPPFKYNSGEPFDEFDLK